MGNAELGTRRWERAGGAMVFGGLLVLAIVPHFAVDNRADAARSVRQGVHTFELGPTDVSSTGLVVIGDYMTRGGFGVEAVVSFEVSVTGGAIGSFCIYVSACPDCNWAPYVCDTDFATATSNMTWATTSNGIAEAPHEVTSGGFAVVTARVPFNRFDFRAQAADTNAFVTVKGTFTNR